MKCLNLGCGDRFHPNWTNVDFVSTGKGVVAYNLRNGVPFPDSCFDVVYHSHLLEHFPKQDAGPFLKECRRVLKPRGIIRIAVPDLESIARTYIKALEKAAQGDEAWQHNYEWITLEMYDQTVRERSGGEMMVYLKQEKIRNREFVLERIGLEGSKNIDEEQQKRTQIEAPVSAARSTPVRILQGFYLLLRDSGFRREWLKNKILGTEYELLQLGRFRRGGEVHLWMYDQYSLAKLLLESEFQNPQPVSPTESQISGWRD